MSTAPLFQLISVRDYLVGEGQVKHQHENVEGAVYLMAGATNAHNRIAKNATGSLYYKLRGQRCQVFNSDAKLRVRLSRGTRFYYPDTMVICQPNPPNETFHDAPIVIIEVISVIPLPEIESKPALAELYENVEFPTPDQIREQKDGYDS